MNEKLKEYSNIIGIIVFGLLVVVLVIFWFHVLKPEENILFRIGTLGWVTFLLALIGFILLGEKEDETQKPQAEGQPLFSWDDDNKLKEYLKKNYKADWVDTVQIVKQGNNIKIIEKDDRKITLQKLDDEIVVLKINDDRTDIFTAKQEKDKLNIYKLQSKEIQAQKFSPTNPKALCCGTGEIRRALTMTIIVVFLALISFGNQIELKETTTQVGNETTTQKTVIQDVLENYWLIVSSVIAFYFTGRAYESAKENGKSPPEKPPETD